MCVRYFQTNNSYTDPVTGEGLPDGGRYFFAKQLKAGKCVIIEVEYVVNFFFRDGEGMTHYKRVDIQKGDIPVVLGDDVSRYLPVDDFCEETCHLFNVLKC